MSSAPLLRIYFKGKFSLQRWISIVQKAGQAKRAKPWPEPRKVGAEKVAKTR